MNTEETVHTQQTEAVGERNLLGRAIPEEELEENRKNVAPVAVQQRVTDRVMFLFQVGKESFGISPGYVECVVNRKDVHRMPGRNAVLGITNLGGLLVPVTDLEGFGGVKREKEANRFLVLCFRSGTFVIVISDARGVHHYKSDEVSTLPLSFSESAEKCLDGVIQIDGSDTSILNPEQFEQYLLRRCL